MFEVSESDFLSIITQGIKAKENVYLQTAASASPGWFSRLRGYISRSSPPDADQGFRVETAQEMLSLLPTEEPSNKLFDARWIFCIDSGGQAAFQDIAPAFLRCNSINIITLR